MIHCYNHDASTVELHVRCQFSGKYHGAPIVTQWIPLSDEAAFHMMDKNYSKQKAEEMFVLAKRTNNWRNGDIAEDGGRHIISIVPPCWYRRRLTEEAQALKDRLAAEARAKREREEEEARIEKMQIEQAEQATRKKTEPCAVCLTLPSTHALISCGHVALCQQCLELTPPVNGKLLCPVCRAVATGSIKVFF